MSIETARRVLSKALKNGGDLAEISPLKKDHRAQESASTRENW